MPLHRFWEEYFAVTLGACVWLFVAPQIEGATSVASLGQLNVVGAVEDLKAARKEA